MARVHQRGLGLDLARDALDHNAPTSSPELVAALLEVAELVEAGAGRRQQDRVPALRLAPPLRPPRARAFHTLPQPCAATRAKRTIRPPRQWYRPCGHDRSAARIRRDCRSSPARRRSSGSLERGERRRGRGRVGRLAVVDEERRRPSRGCAPCGAGGRGRCGEPRSICRRVKPERVQATIAAAAF